MKKLDPILKKNIEEYNEIVHEAQRHAIICRSSKLQREQIKILKDYIRKLEKAKKSFILNKKEYESNFFLSMQHGSAAVASELEMLVKLKQNKPAIAWNLLVTAQVLTQNVIRNKLFKEQGLEGYYDRLIAYEQLLFPFMGFSSVGAIVHESICTICKKDYDDCDHMKGKYYMGKMCCREIIDWEPEEISFVENPADKRCRLISFTDRKGNNVDLLTLEKIMSKNEEKKTVQQFVC